jgi:hypothetical protein
LLSPDIIEAVLEGRQAAAIELADLLKQFSTEWDKQLANLDERKRTAGQLAEKADPNT